MMFSEIVARLPIPTKKRLEFVHVLVDSSLKVHRFLPLRSGLRYSPGGGGGPPTKRQASTTCLGVRHASNYRRRGP